MPLGGMSSRNGAAPPEPVGAFAVVLAEEGGELARGAPSLGRRSSGFLRIPFGLGAWLEGGGECRGEADVGPEEASASGSML